MTLFKLICLLYQIHRQTLPIMKIDRGQIQFREYVSTVTEQYNYINIQVHVHAHSIEGLDPVNRFNHTSRVDVAIPTDRRYTIVV